MSFKLSIQEADCLNLFYANKLANIERLRTSSRMAVKKTFLLSHFLLPLFTFFLYTTSLSAHVNSTPPLSKEALEIPFKTLIGEKKGGANKERKQIRPEDFNQFKLLAREYEQKRPLLNTARLDSIIPKKLHIIWIGPKAFPEESINNMLSWQKFNSDWEIHFWTDSKTRPLPLPTMKRRLVYEYDFSPLHDLIPQTMNWGEKSDLMRFAIIYNEGGVYVDHDAECLKSFDPFVNNFTFFACLERPHYHASIDTCVIPANGLFGAVPKHVILEKTMERVLQVWDSVAQEFPNFDRRSNLQRVIRRTFDSFALASIQWRNQPGYNDIILPTAYFYPDMTFTSKFQDKLKKSGIVFSSHKFAGAWKDPSTKKIARKSSHRR